MFKYLNFAPDDGGDDLGGDDTKDLDVSATLKELKDTVTGLTTVAESVKKAQDAGMGASRKVDKLTKDFEKLEGQFTGLTESLGKFSDKLDKITPKEADADDTLADALKGNGKDGATTQEMLNAMNAMQKTIQSKVDESLDKFTATFAEKSEAYAAEVEAKLEAAQWNDLLEKSNIPEDMKSFVPVGDKDKLEQVKKIAETVAKSNKDADGDTTTTTTTADGKTIGVKEPGEPIPSGAGEATNTKSAEMTNRLEKCLKDGDLDNFQELWAEAADKEIPLDTERLLNLFEKAGSKKAAEDRKERQKVHI